MRHAFIYRITDKLSKKVWYIYASNKHSAKRWQHENLSEITAEIECVGEKKAPIAEHAREFDQDEYNTMFYLIGSYRNPDLWKALMPEKQRLPGID